MSEEITTKDRVQMIETLNSLREQETIKAHRAGATTYSDIYRAMGQSEGPVTHIKELAKMLDVSCGTIRHRLHKMEDKGVITRKRMGERTEVWYFPESQDDNPFHPVNFVRFRNFLEQEVLSND